MNGGCPLLGVKRTWRATRSRPHMALNGHHNRAPECPLLGVKRTCHYGFRTSSGSLAIFAAIRRASSRVPRLAVL